jgi:hypothetical protein
MKALIIILDNKADYNMLDLLRVCSVILLGYNSKILIQPAVSKHLQSIYMI